MIKPNKYKNNAGSFLLRELFFEKTLADKVNVMYTLKDQEHEGFPALREFYLSIADPTEYKFAVECLDGWAHWERLCECEWFKPFLDRWRLELELSIKAEALACIIKMAKENGKQSFDASKYLLTNAWVKEKAKAGRPTKGKIKDAAYDKYDVLQDFKRLTAEPVEPVAQAI